MDGLSLHYWISTVALSTKELFMTVVSIPRPSAVAAALRRWQALPAAFASLSLPLLFILLWSSGYVAGKLALPHAGPFPLLSLRFGLAAGVLLLISLATTAPWPRRGREWVHLAVVGLLMQVLHFSGEI